MTQKRNIKELTKYIQKYWQKRAENDYLAGEKDVLQVAKELKANYTNCLNEINNIINQFYIDYAKDNKISLAEANKLLSNTELKSFKKQMQELGKLYKKKGYDLKEVDKLERRAKITRLEDLKAQINFKIDELTNSNEEQIQDLLSNTFEDNYYKTVYNTQQFKGFSSSFSRINPDIVQRAINTKYLGANYSDRIWQNKSNLMTTLTQEIPRGLTLGYNPKKLAEQVSTKLDTNYNNTVRLIRTEYTKVLNDSTFAGYEASGITKYKILATLDSRTCDICGTYYDSKIYNVKEALVGINKPPFHANCRCTTIPYFEPDEYDDLDATAYNYKSNMQVPLNITYNEWKENLHTTANNKLIYKNK